MQQYVTAYGTAYKKLMVLMDKITGRGLGHLRFQGLLQPTFALTPQLGTLNKTLQVLTRPAYYL